MRFMSTFGNMDFCGWQGYDHLGLRFLYLSKLEDNTKQGEDNLP